MITRLRHAFYFCLSLYGPWVSRAHASEIFAGIGKGTDLSLGFTDTMTPDFSIRYEYNFNAGRTRGDWYRYTDDVTEIDERKTLKLRIQGLAIGGQQKFFASGRVWGSLHYSQAEGRIERDRLGLDRRDHSFLYRTLNIQFGWGHSWEVGEEWNLGFEGLVVLNNLTESFSVGEIDSMPQSQFAVKRDIRASAAALQELKLLRLVVGREF